MNEYEMVAFIVLMVMITVMVTTRMKYNARKNNSVEGPTANPQLEAEVERLRDRVQTLERIAVDKEDSLTRQIEQLRER